LQLSHAVYPDKCTVGLYVGASARVLFQPARDRMVAEEGEALRLLNELIERGYSFSFAPHDTRPEVRPACDATLDAPPDGFRRAQGIWVRRSFPRADVLACGPQLVARALEEQAALWPLYRFWAEAA